ncbi:hypothetical protein QQM41_03650 [Acetobacter sp. AC2005]|uniref:Uncharacterized protein n=1 Tax=Acetobacter pasteurianus subsp. pasteurianus TaxID=481145 RepID=A0A1Y0Y3Q9_ACEPA|nr:hypothetical protein [Acetobacter pasteurianus]ARW47097.1 hypothetical protein S1001342_00740 [Acetobacter pasteurianus subsp. pasteurianus]ASC05040.1 hypothetical protein S101468_00773 [Acetobacter pasteurianus subsp. pasteurianus]
MSERDPLSRHELDCLADLLFDRLAQRLRQSGFRLNEENIIIERMDINTLPVSMRGAGYG